jgi:hypothetical protein
MSLVTYADLQSAVGNWLARADLAAVIPDLITLFETVANRRLRVRQQEATVSLTPVNGVATLPADYLAWRRVTWTGDIPRELEFVHPSYLRALFPTLPQGDPRYFCIENGNLTLGPSDNTALTFDYFQKIAALSNTNASNWLLATAPDLYLFGALAEAHGFVKDTESLALWKSRRDELFDEIDRLDVKTRGQSGIRVIGPTP